MQSDVKRRVQKISLRIAFNKVLRILWFAVFFCPITGHADYFFSEGPNAAIIIKGLYGNSNEYKSYMDLAVKQWESLLTENGFQSDQIFIFSEDSSKKNVLSVFFDQQKNTYKNVFVFIAGHANGRDENAMFHLPGEDVSYQDLMKWLSQISAQRMLVVLAVPHGEVWIKHFSAPGRMLLAGNQMRDFDYIPINFLRVFPEVFSGNALGQLSLYDAFVETQKKVQKWYFDNLLYPTEVGIMDADGDGIGDSLIPEGFKPDYSKVLVKDTPSATSVKNEEAYVFELPIKTESKDGDFAKKVVFRVKQVEPVNQNEEKGVKH